MSLSSKQIVEMGHQYIMGNVKRYELALARGEGMKLWDADNKEYIDFLAGVATCALGYAPEIIVKTISQQAARLIHISNYFYSEPMVELAKMLCISSGLDKAFFCNSGAEANEAAIKLARKYSLDQYGHGRYGIITAKGSFHGRTLGTISATGQSKVKEGFEPLLPGFTHVPYGDIKALADGITDQTCAIMLEPVLGEGGVVVPSQAYLPQVAKLCEDKGLLLILDEIQTGIGRTGREYAFQHYGLSPHIITLAKAIGGGVATGAMLAKEEVAVHLTPGSHSTTVGGAPLAMAVGMAMVCTIFEPDFLEHVRITGLYFMERLKDLASELGRDVVKEVRGQGLLIGMELTRPSAPVVADMMQRGFLINATADTVLRFAPPLIVEKEHIDKLLPALKDSITSVYKK